ncbi:hypothetical protein CB0940_06541 [Cercospora beticola]|uniref:F-box domain-containing protein n=1 Tax=Cercospora beticola TaxID=122368 RepID=A0A2G5HWZ0_CERBT|nr:hypothetical protein CB0940_06541 [Cercospora beticola]PIA97056.1 hypothetical protein CB0940_06541 [Cercospora beticola]WPA99179.1 hypothetical protein RHO25_003795 [Cercospora beticola]
MGSDLQRLNHLAADPELAAYVKVISIADDSELVDPYASSELPMNTAYHIWPRYESGNIDLSQLDVTAVQSVLRQKLIQPHTILTRDYRIEAANFKFCSEMDIVQSLLKPTGDESSHGITALNFAREVIEGGDLAMKSIKYSHIGAPFSQSSPLHLPRFAQSGHSFALGSSRVSELRIDFAPDKQGHGTGFTMLRSADLRLDRGNCTYWLEQIFYHAASLRDLNISIERFPGYEAISADRVIPNLESFRLSHTKLPADLICTFLAASANSLTQLHLVQVTLVADSTWLELLSILARRLPALEQFTLGMLGEEGSVGNMAVDYRELLSKVHFEEQYHPGLKLVVKGPAEKKRVARLSYKGPNAAAVLRFVAKHRRLGVPNTGVAVA